MEQRTRTRFVFNRLNKLKEQNKQFTNPYCTCDTCSLRRAREMEERLRPGQVPPYVAWAHNHRATIYGRRGEAGHLSAAQHMENLASLSRYYHATQAMGEGRRYTHRITPYPPQTLIRMNHGYAPYPPQSLEVSLPSPPPTPPKGIEIHISQKSSPAVPPPSDDDASYTSESRSGSTGIAYDHKDLPKIVAVHTVVPLPSVPPYPSINRYMSPSYPPFGHQPPAYCKPLTGFTGNYYQEPTVKREKGLKEFTCAKTMGSSTENSASEDELDESKYEHNLAYPPIPEIDVCHSVDDGSYRTDSEKQPKDLSSTENRDCSSEDEGRVGTPDDHKTTKDHGVDDVSTEEQSISNRTDSESKQHTIDNDSSEYEMRVGTPEGQEITNNSKDMESEENACLKEIIENGLHQGVADEDIDEEDVIIDDDMDQSVWCEMDPEQATHIQYFTGSWHPGLGEAPITKSQDGNRDVRSSQNSVLTTLQELVCKIGPNTHHDTQSYSVVPSDKVKEPNGIDVHFKDNQNRAIENHSNINQYSQEENSSIGSEHPRSSPLEDKQATLTTNIVRHRNTNIDMEASLQFNKVMPQPSPTEPSSEQSDGAQEEPHCKDVNLNENIDMETPLQFKKVSPLSPTEPSSEKDNGAQDIVTHSDFDISSQGENSAMGSEEIQETAQANTDESIDMEKPFQCNEALSPPSPTHPSSLESNGSQEEPQCTDVNPEDNQKSAFESHLNLSSHEGNSAFGLAVALETAPKTADDLDENVVTEAPFHEVLSPPSPMVQSSEKSNEAEIVQHSEKSNGAEMVQRFEKSNGAEMSQRPEKSNGAEMVQSSEKCNGAHEKPCCTDINLDENQESAIEILSDSGKSSQEEISVIGFEVPPSPPLEDIPTNIVRHRNENIDKEVSLQFNEVVFSESPTDSSSEESNGSEEGDNTWEKHMERSSSKELFKSLCKRMWDIRTADNVSCVEAHDAQPKSKKKRTLLEVKVVDDDDETDDVIVVDDDYTAVDHSAKRCVLFKRKTFSKDGHKRGSSAGIEEATVFPKTITSNSGNNELSSSEELTSSFNTLPGRNAQLREGRIHELHRKREQILNNINKIKSKPRKGLSRDV